MKQQGDHVFTSHEQSTPARPRRRPARLTGHARMLSGLALAGLTSMGAGCGDGPICASDIAVFITTPDNGATLIEDTDPFPGTVSDVVVRTNLREGELVNLAVTDELGQLWQYTGQVDALGTATFVGVQIPPGYTSLEATGVAGECGSGVDAISVLVGDVSSSCVLELLQEPEYNEFYAPLPVFNSFADWNELADDLQLSLNVSTLPGFGVDLFITDLDSGLETLAGSRITDATGLAGYTVNLGQGPQALRADCYSLVDGSRVSTGSLSMYVDTEVPDCNLLSPATGTLLDPFMDLDGDASNGTQIELAGQIGAGMAGSLADVVPLFVVNSVKFEGSAPDSEGRTTFIATLDQPGSYFLGLSAEDYAGNRCDDTQIFDYGTQGTFVQAVNRQALLVSWTAPDVGGGAAASEYLVRIAEEPVDDSNFDDVGREVGPVPAPGTPGALESLVIEELDAGKSYYVAVLAVNTFGDRVLVGAGGPVDVGFAATGAIGPIAPDQNIDGLGHQVAPGNFNGDEYGDLAVAAPFKTLEGQHSTGTVYVFFGGPDGLGDTPDVTIEGTPGGGLFGSGLTAMRWNDDEVDDLVVGQPAGNDQNGAVYVFLGGDGFDTATGPADADVTVSGGGAAGDWFAGGLLGFALTTARFDDDSRDDLVMSAPGGGSGSGGIVVLYDGATSTDIVLSTLDAGGSGDATALVLQAPDLDFEEPPGTPEAFFGQYLFRLGPTQGASDTNDDIGVAYTQRNAAVVFRGRPQVPAPGVILASFEPTIDLAIVRDSPDPTTSFGTTMGSIDLDGTGVRDIVVGIWRELGNIGRVEIYKGDAVGVQEAKIPFRRGFINPTSGLQGLGSAVVNNAAGLVDPDVNGDGREDLMVVGGLGAGGVAMLVWYGGNIPALFETTTATADHAIVAPPPFAGLAGSDATPVTAIWAGDVNGDGLEDICWADSSANDGDGAFELLHDQGPSLDGILRATPLEPVAESSAATARAHSVMLGRQP